MPELFPYYINLEDELEAIDRNVTKNVQKTGLLLELTVNYLLLGKLDEYRSEIDHLIESIDPDDPEITFKRSLDYIAALKLLGHPCDIAIQRAEKQIQASLDHPNDSYMLSVVLESLIAFTMLKKDKPLLRQWRQERWRIPPTGYDRDSLEVLYLSRRMLEDSPPSSNFAWEARDALYEVDGDFRRQVTLAFYLSAERAGLSLVEILHNAAAQLDTEVFPNGEEKPARFTISGPQFSLIKRKQERILEARVKVSGSGGRIHAPGVLLKDLIYSMPKYLYDLIEHDIPVDQIRRAGKRSEIDNILRNPDGMVEAVLELDGDIFIAEEDLTSYAERLTEGANWLTSFENSFAPEEESRFRARTALRMEK